MRLRRALALLAAAAAAWLAAPACGQASAPPSEAQVKAAFVYNVMRFVGWPQTSGALRLCTVGDDALAGALAGLAGKPLDSLSIEVRALGARAPLAQCDVVYVAASAASATVDIVRGLEGRAVLTVGDAPGLAQQGLIVNFFLQEERVRFEINPVAAQRAGVKISSQLLSLARIVRDERTSR
jgi:hypothetical protein